MSFVPIKGLVSRMTSFIDVELIISNSASVNNLKIRENMSHKNIRILNAAKMAARCNLPVICVLIPEAVTISDTFKLIIYDGSE